MSKTETFAPLNPNPKSTPQRVTTLTPTQLSAFYDETPEDYIPYVKPATDPLAASYAHTMTAKGWR